MIIIHDDNLRVSFTMIVINIMKIISNIALKIFIVNREITGILCIAVLLTSFNPHYRPGAGSPGDGAGGPPKNRLGEPKKPDKPQKFSGFDPSGHERAAKAIREIDKSRE